MDKLHKNSAGSIVGFNEQQFIDEICSSDNCCICAKPIDEQNSNREHVIPDWLLRHAHLHDETIMLPNATTLKYGQYVVPCCIDCNSDYGKRLEQRLSPLLTSGYDHFVQNATPEDRRYLFVWLSWVYFKTHYKDINLRLHRDRRKGDHMIGDMYDLRQLHHVHAIARSLHTGAILDNGCYGTLLALRADSGDLDRFYDFRDFNIPFPTLMIRIDSLALLVALDDGGQCGEFMLELSSRIGDNQLSPVQLREMLAHITYERCSLSQPTTFATEYDPRDDTIRIISSQPKAALKATYSPQQYGNILYYSLSNILDHHGLDEQTVRSGNCGFMFDDRGNFVKQSSPRAKR